jgi:hypothetical protein
MSLRDEEFVLKVYGKHNLTFKAKHPDENYLKKVGEQLVAIKDTEFTHYEVHFNSEANEEMTHPNKEIHPTFD